MTTSSITSRRSLHLVDFENLTGGGGASAASLLAVFDEYLDMSGWQPGDHLALAANPSVMRKIGFDLPVPCNAHAVRGTDSADLMLLSLAPPELVARRYGRLVVGSGDGIFAARAERARSSASVYRSSPAPTAAHAGSTRSTRCTWYPTSTSLRRKGSDAQ